MVVARVVGQNLQVISRHKQSVQLAMGLDDGYYLHESAIERGLQCLSMFAESLVDLEPNNIRSVATYTLRQAVNSDDFIQQAEHVFPYPIEIIPGVEEARLIYMGVAHTQAFRGPQFVIDIGGGSTEFNLGEGFECYELKSKHMGCISFSKRFFPGGEITVENFAAAELAAEQKLEAIVGLYQSDCWQRVIGTSGTIRSIEQVILELMGEGLTQDNIDILINRVLEF